MSSIPALLDRYSGGDIEGVVAAFGAINDVEHVREELEAAAGDWIDAAFTEDVTRRRLVVATFALELVRARMQDEWERLRPLVEWSCELLRGGPPTEAERLWHRASIALAMGAGD